ncbi:MAG: hypothetical protein LBN07_04850 [Christensenellaceae bacterium]|jgi:plasmid maintenance system antidote protein VapI|nr:hypothetical protein [Christensenellaceae bacterium]
MKIKIQLLQAFLKERKITALDLAKEMEVDVSEIEKLLKGEAVDEKAAHKFIYYFGADEAQHFIDWEAIGKKNPLINESDTNEN